MFLYFCLFVVSMWKRWISSVSYVKCCHIPSSTGSIGLSDPYSTIYEYKEVVLTSCSLLFLNLSHLREGDTGRCCMVMPSSWDTTTPAWWATHASSFSPFMMFNVMTLILLPWIAVSQLPDDVPFTHRQAGLWCGPAGGLYRYTRRTLDSWNKYRFESSLLAKSNGLFLCWLIRAVGDTDLNLFLFTVFKK